MMNNIHRGLDNPHPFSQMKTELIWEGKYDEYGDRRMVDIAWCAMSLQKIKAIESRPPAPKCRATCSIRPRPIMTIFATGWQRRSLRNAG